MVVYFLCKISHILLLLWNAKKPFDLSFGMCGPVGSSEKTGWIPRSVEGGIGSFKQVTNVPSLNIGFFFFFSSMQCVWDSEEIKDTCKYQYDSDRWIQRLNQWFLTFSSEGGLSKQHLSTRVGISKTFSLSAHIFLFSESRWLVIGKVRLSVKSKFVYIFIILEVNFH